MTWQESAACRDADHELFSLPLTPQMLTAARAVCAGCPVASECLTEGLERGDDVMVRAGTTPDERRAMRRQRIETGRTLRRVA